MELKDFVSDSITQIMEGVKEAQQKGKELGGSVVPFSYNVQGNRTILDSTNQRLISTLSFDVAVTATETTDKGARGGIKVMSIQLGGEANNNVTSGSTSRLCFEIPIILPGDHEQGNPHPHHQSKKPAYSPLKHGR